MSARDGDRSRRALVRVYRRRSGLSDAFVHEVSGASPEGTAEGAVVFDVRGEPYLDLAGGFGVFAVGHGHPAVRAAVLDELRAGRLAPPLRSEPERRARAAVDGVLPPDLETVGFAARGSRAMDLALGVCLAGGRSRVVAATGGFHGTTLATLGLSGNERWRRIGARPVARDVTFVPYGDAAALGRALAGTPACFVVEPLQGETLLVPPPGYLREVRRACSESGAWLVADEVSTGFGRTGKMWGVDHEGVVPDLLAFSKAATGGYAPIAGLAARPAITADARRTGWAVEPATAEPYEAVPALGLAAAAAAIDVIVREGLVARAAGMGERLRSHLRALTTEFPRLLRGVRGQGLMCGLATRDIAVHHALWLDLIKRRVLVAPATDVVSRAPVLRFLPPFVVRSDQVDLAGERLHAALKSLDRWPAPLFGAASAAIRARDTFPPPVVDAALRLFSRVA